MKNILIIILLLTSVYAQSQNVVAKRLILNGNTLTDAETGDTVMTLESFKDSISYYVLTATLNNNYWTSTRTEDTINARIQLYSDTSSTIIGTLNSNEILYGGSAANSIESDDSLTKLDIFHDKSNFILQFGNSLYHMRSSLTSGSNNVSFGDLSLSSITSGNGNMAIGNGVMGSMTTGSENTAIGSSSLSLNVTGQQNTAIGFQSLFNATEDKNTAIGYLSLENTTTGDGNIAIGWYAGNRATTLSNRIYVNSFNRGSLESDTINSIIYGLQNATSSNQELYLNSNVHVKHDLTVSGTIQGNSLNITDANVTGNIFIGDSGTILNTTGFTPQLGNYNQTYLYALYDLNNQVNLALRGSDLSGGSSAEINIYDGGALSSYIFATDQFTVPSSISAEDSSDIMTACVKWHKQDSMNINSSGVWLDVKFDTLIADESTYGISIDDDSSTFVFTTSGLFEVYGCFHRHWNGGVGIESAYIRGLQDGSEMRCLQETDTHENGSNDYNSNRYGGTLRVVPGTTFKLQVQVTDVDMDLEGDPTFDKPVAATIVINKLSK